MGAARAYVAAARDLDDDGAEELFRLAEEAAQRTGDAGLIGEVTFELAKHREARRISPVRWLRVSGRPAGS